MTSLERLHAHAQSRDTRTDNSQRIQRGGTGSRAEVHDHGSKVTAYIALIMTGITLGMFMMYVLLIPQLLDAKIGAGAAQAEATAKEARSTAKVTEDKLGELRDALNSKGMNIPPLNGH